MSARVKYKLLAVDLDGTLLRRDGSIHESDRAAIARLQGAGIPVTIATGRLFSGSIASARMAGIEGPIACVDGSHIVAASSGEEHLHRTLRGEHALALRGVLARHDAASFLFANDSIVH
ncbi:MAG TPA: HAD hydrolase family protein, partial [Polyangiaceae bacterium]